MWNKRKHLVVLTAVAGLLAMPTMDAFAQSVSPFGKGNPLDNLQRQIDELRQSDATQVTSFVVDCGRGQRVADALAQATQSTNRVTIKISGICRENLIITRDSVTLEALESGAGFAATAPSVALTLKGRRIVLRGLTLTGGNVGLLAINGSQFFANNLRVSGARTGVQLYGNTTGGIDASTVENNTEGIWVGMGSSLSLGSSIVRNNQSIGIQAGQANITLASGTVISGNKGGGALAGSGGTIVIWDSRIEQNDGPGVNVTGGTVSVAGGGVISDNNGPGVLVEGSGHLDLAKWDQLAGPQVINNQAGGVVVSNGGSVTAASGAVIESNQGIGLELRGASSANLYGATIRGNTKYGVVLRATSVAYFNSTSITGNGWPGLRCIPTIPMTTPVVAQITGQVVVSGNGVAGGRPEQPDTVNCLAF